MSDVLISDTNLVKVDNTKVFNFKHNISLTLTKSRIFKMYDGLGKYDYKLWSLLYLTSSRFREYLFENYPTYVSYLTKDMEEYEYNVENTFSSLLYDIQQNDFVIAGYQTSEAYAIANDNLQSFIELEMDMWIKWAFNKHTEDKMPVHLLRYIIGNSII